MEDQPAGGHASGPSALPTEGKTFGPGGLVPPVAAFHRTMLDGLPALNWERSGFDELLSLQAATVPDRPLLGYLGDGEALTQELSALALHERACAVAGLLAHFVPQVETRQLEPEKVEPGLVGQEPVCTGPSKGEDTASVRVLLGFPNGTDAVAALFGCAYAGMVPVSGYYPGMPDSVGRLAAILEDARPAVFLAPRAVLEEARRAPRIRALLARWRAAGGRAPLKWVPFENAPFGARPSVVASGSGPSERGNGSGAPPLAPLYRHRARWGVQVALVQYSSGATGHPRGVCLSHRNIGANLQALVRAVGVEPDMVGLSWLPLTHDMGLVLGLLLGLSVGLRVRLMAPEHFIEQPARWVRAMARHRIGFTAGPDFAYDLCARAMSAEEAAALDLSAWKYAVIGGEALSSATQERFLARFGPSGIRSGLFQPGYGMAETTLVIAHGPLNQGVAFGAFSRAGLAQGRAVPPRTALDRRLLACCGQVLPGHDVCVVEPETGRLLADGEVGEIWVAGPCVARGYLGRAEENVTRFGLARPSAADMAPNQAGLVGGDGPAGAVRQQFFRTRDRGFLHGPERALYVMGRLETGLRFGAEMYDSDDLAALARLGGPELAGHGVAVWREGAGLCVVAEAAPTLSAHRAAEVMDAMSRMLQQGAPLGREHFVHLVRPGALPRTPSGKLRLGVARALWREGRLPLLCPLGMEGGACVHHTQADLDARLLEESPLAMFPELATEGPGGQAERLRGRRPSSWQEKTREGEGE